MSMGTCWAAGTWANPSWASGSWASLGTATLELVEAPTRLTTMRRYAKVGDTVVITDTLQGYDRTPQDLTDATVVFTLVGPDGTTPIVDRVAVTIVQSGDVDTGKVTVTIPASTAIPVGTSRWEFEASWNAGETVLTFPDDVNGELVVMAALG